jgi:diketogulonate reductase-like aldo/keto reductase
VWLSNVSPLKPAQLLRHAGTGRNDFIKETGIPRADITYTSKIQSNSTYEHARQTVENSLKLAKQDCLDLYLIHAPYPNRKARLETWRALEDAQREGKIKSIGVSVSSVVS